MILPLPTSRMPLKISVEVRPFRCDPVTTERAEVVRNEMASRLARNPARDAIRSDVSRQLSQESLGCAILMHSHHTPTPRVLVGEDIV